MDSKAMNNTITIDGEKLYILYYEILRNKKIKERIIECYEQLPKKYRGWQKQITFNFVSFLILRNEFKIWVKYPMKSEFPDKKYRKEIINLLNKKMVCRVLLSEKSCFNINTLLKQFQEELEVNEEITNKAKSILKSFNSTGKDIGINPIGLIGAAFYISSKLLSSEPFSQRKIGDVFQTTEATIRKNCRLIFDNIPYKIKMLNDVKKRRNK